MSGCNDEDLGKVCRRQLECPVCCETFVSPIFMCVNGHNLCGSCQRKLAFCPICYAVGRPSLRNLLAEEISGTNWAQCKSSDCPAVVRVEAMPAHVAVCPRGFLCTLGTCDWRGSVAETADHARRRHGAEIAPPSVDSLAIETSADAARVAAALLVYLFQANVDNVAFTFRLVEVFAVFLGCYVRSVWTEVSIFVAPLEKALRAVKMLPVFCAAACLFLCLIAIVYFVLAMHEYDCLPSSYEEDRYLRWLNYLTAA